MSLIFIVGIFAIILIFISVVLAGVAMWALVTKKEMLPQWGKVVLWLFIILAAILVIGSVIGLFVILSNVPASNMKFF